MSGPATRRACAAASVLTLAAASFPGASFGQDEGLEPWQRAALERESRDAEQLFAGEVVEADLRQGCWSGCMMFTSRVTYRVVEVLRGWPATTVDVDVLIVGGPGTRACPLYAKDAAGDALPALDPTFFRPGTRHLVSTAPYQEGAGGRVFTLAGVVLAATPGVLDLAHQLEADLRGSVEAARRVADVILVGEVTTADLSLGVWSGRAVCVRRVTYRALEVLRGPPGAVVDVDVLIVGGGRRDPLLAVDAQGQAVPALDPAFFRSGARHVVFLRSHPLLPGRPPRLVAVVQASTATLDALRAGPR